VKRPQWTSALSVDALHFSMLHISHTAFRTLKRGRSHSSEQHTVAADE